MKQKPAVASSLSSYSPVLFFNDGKKLPTVLEYFPVFDSTLHIPKKYSIHLDRLSVYFHYSVLT